jgi:phage host-nuclease inhibitor protein Gam
VFRRRVAGGLGHFQEANAVKDWTDFDKGLREIALIDLELGRAVGERDHAKVEADTKYAKVAAPLSAKRVVLTEELERYYRAHRKEVEEDGKKSIDLVHGRAGIRKGNPTLALRKKWTWEKVVEAIKGRLPNWKQFITTKESVDKDAVKKANLPEFDMELIGCRIKQDEEFFVETYPDKVQDAV